MLLLTAVGCAKTDTSPAALTYGETSVSETVYRFLASTFKARYLSEYSDITDSDEFWKGDFGGKTGEELLNSLVYDNVVQTLVSAENFRAAGQSLTDGQKKTVTDYVNSMIEELGSGDRDTLDGYLEEFGIDTDILTDVFMLEEQAAAYFEYIYADGGPDALTDSKREQYYLDSYVRFLQIYVNTSKTYVIDDDGNYVTDEDGKYKMRALTSDELEDAYGRINTVRDSLESGEDFASLIDPYSDSTEYKGGYYFSPDTESDYLIDVVEAARSLDVDGWTYVDLTGETGGFFVKRLKLDTAAYKDSDNSDFFGNFDTEVKTALFRDKIDAAEPDVEKNEEFFGNFTVKNVPANYYYY